MRIWVITVGEPLPIDGPSQRLLRSGLLVKQMVTRGHEVVWWTSTVDHFNRTQRSGTSKVLGMEDGAELVLLHGRLYQRSISFTRIANHRETAQEFTRLAGDRPSPDLILSSYPTLELCEAALNYAEPRGIPVAVDVRDRWPHTFLEVVPGPIRVVGRPFLAPMFAQAERIFSKADAILGNTDDMVEWGIAQSGRSRKSLDRAFPFGYEPAEVTEAQEAAANEFWMHRLALEPSDFIVAFGGTLNHSFELETVIEAARILQSSQPSVRWVICGQGDRVPSYKALAQGISSVHFMGWVGSPEMHALLRRVDVGLMPYCANNNFGGSIPNKCIEYLCYGLPILSTLASGTPRRALEEAGCGLFYENGKPETLVDGVMQLLESKERRSKMSQGARGYFEQHFRAEAVYGRMVDHLESLARAPVATS